MRSSSSVVDTFGAVRLIPRHGMPSLPRPVVAWIVAGAERISYHQLCCNEYRSNESNQIEKAVCREASTCDLVTSYSSSENHSADGGGLSSPSANSAMWNTR